MTVRLCTDAETENKMALTKTMDFKIVSSQTFVTCKKFHFGLFIKIGPCFWRCTRDVGSYIFSVKFSIC